MLKINDIVKIKYDFLSVILPLPEYKITDIMKVNSPGTSGEWVKITEYNDWIDSSYFIKK